MANDELPVIQRAFDFALWACDHTSRFPRRHRFGLGERIEREVCELLVLLAQARFTRERGAILGQANLSVEALRVLVRLSASMRCLRPGSYEHAARELHEIGSMIGGWRRLA